MSLPFYENILISLVAIIFPFSFTKIGEKIFAKSFEKYQTTQIIIDRTDIFVERATSVQTQTQT